MSTPTIDYDALAKQAGAVSSTVDYDALAKQAGAVSSVPDPQSQPDPSLLSRAGSAAIDVGEGFAKGAVQTVNTVSGLLNKIPGVGEYLAPSEGVQAADQWATPTNTAQKVGVGAESLAEMLLGDESLKGLSLGEKLLNISKVADTYEKASPFVRSAIEAGLKGGILTGGETFAKTGDVEQAAKEGAVGAATGAIAGPALVGAGKAVGAIRNAYRGLMTVDSVQPVLQNGIRDVLSNVADEAGVDAPQSSSIRQAASELADNIREKSQPVFEKLDELSDGEFSNAQADAKRYAGAIDKEGKDAYADALLKQNAIFDKFADQFDPDALNDAKANWKQAARLDDVSKKIQQATSGSKPMVQQLSGQKLPAEAVNAKQLDKALNMLDNDGDLSAALGGDERAQQLLEHTGAANQRIANILRNQKVATKAGYVGGAGLVEEGLRRGIGAIKK
jgi:hypothetical protein